MIESNEVTFSPNLVYWRDEALCAAGGTLSLNSGCPPQLTKRKKLSKGKGCQARCYARLVEKVGAIQFIKCSTCGHLNFKRYLACIKCKQELTVKEETKTSVIFWDIERASGHATSDPIQIGLLNIDVSNGEILSELEVNIFPKSKIDWYGSKLHGIKLTKDGSSLMKKGEVLSNVKTQEEAIRSLDDFISKCNAKYLVSHGAVDVETFDSLLQRNLEIESPNYLRMKKVDSLRKICTGSYLRQNIGKLLEDRDAEINWEFYDLLRPSLRTKYLPG